MIKIEDKLLNSSEFLHSWLSGLNVIGTKKYQFLISEYETVKNLFLLPGEIGEDEARTQLNLLFQMNLEKVFPKEIDALLSDEEKLKAVENYKRYVEDGIKITTIDSVGYPDRIRDIFDPPYILYYRGNLPEGSSVAMVGARACTEYGRKMAKDIARDLALHDVNVISGFARGIDSAAHNGALSANGKTYAIFGCGVNVCYPSENHFMYQEIIEKGGGVISEYPPNAQPMAWQFPLRNRIISGISDLLIVIEAGERSGSLISADLALEQNRTVMALPGRVCDRLSTGANRLIRQGAGIITGMEDIYYELGFSTDNKGKSGTSFDTDLSKINKELQIILAKSEKMLYSQLDFNPQSAQTLGEKCCLSTEEVLRGLAKLELEGLIVERGGCYMRV